jgi:hypothetical protein
MRKLIVVLATVAALAIGIGAAAPSSAQACRTVRCFNKTISTLQAQVGALSSQVQSLNTCLKRVAVTSYFGYDYQGVANNTTALDFTTPGDLVDAWMVAIQPGTCGSPSLRTAGSATQTRSSPVLQPLQVIPTGITRSP